MPIDFGYAEEKKLGKPYDMKLLLRLYPFAKTYYRLFISVILLVVLITFLDLSLPYITKIAIDRYIVPQAETTGKEPSSVSEGIEDRKEKVRYYRADMEEADVKDVVQRYSELFVQTGMDALIPFKDLSRLEKQDLKILRKKDLSGVGQAAAVLLALVTCSFILNFFQVLIMEYIGQKIMHDLRVHLFSHVQRLSVSFFTKNPVGRLVTRVTNDIENMNELFTSVIAFVFKDLFLLVGIAIVLLNINLKLALVSFTVLPVVLLVSFRFSSLARDAFRILRIKLAEINSRLSETIGGIKIIQLFGQQEDNFQHFKKLNHENYLAGMRQLQVFAIFMPAIELLGAITVAMVVFYGGNEVLSGDISLGAMVAFISYMRMFFRPMRDLAEKYNVLQNAMASAERIFLILDNQDELPPPPFRFGRPTGEKHKTKRDNY